MLRRSIFSVAKVYPKKHIPHYYSTQEEEERQLQNEYNFSQFKSNRSYYEDSETCEELEYLNYICILHGNRN